MLLSAYGTAAVWLVSGMAFAAADAPALEQSEPGAAQRVVQAHNDRVIVGPLIDFPEVGLAVEQPHGFQKALSFHGLQDYQSGATVVLMTVPSPYARATERFFAPGAMAQHGMRLRSRSSVSLGGRPGLLLLVDQAAHGDQYRKWIVLFGTAKFTHMVTASFPVSQAPVLSEQMRQVALSAIAVDEPVKPVRLPFVLGAVDGMTPVHSAAAAGRIALYTRDGKLAADDAGDPLFIASPSAQSFPITDVDDFANQRLYASGATRIERVTSTKPVHVDGLRGIEIEAQGRDSQTNKPLAIYQMMLFPSDGGFVVMRGTVGAATREDYIARFRRLARTYKSSPDRDN